ncbi:HNH endonuclease [Allokutzneria sp. A3M-2-11 16]|uniref:HNH endonuclease signature motif containing protein n=1 Tax=Allokutzneria sp. A3M-2-11 16 TaxID=2962043 RepID=UPI0020B8CE51|nr:HNH endonuclease signature motif containing protein [Allokutzneria sp. A3M-2-11 16]MCP3805531.1 HNH endonuclease [Allokutzneria sp. A3M-2-11 16]
MPPADIEDHILASYIGIGAAIAKFDEIVATFFHQLSPHDQQYAADILMPLLHITQVKGNRLLGRALDLVARPGVLEALADGRLDEGKALMIVDQLSVLSAVDATTAEPALITHAATNNHPATQRYAKRFIHKLDAEAALRRHQEKRKQRLVEKFVLDDGMCSLRLVMSAVDAALAFDRIDRIARALPKDDRTLDQKRADVATDLFLGKETAAPQGEVRVHITMPLTTALGLTNDPAELAGYGPIPAEVARTAAANGVWKWIKTDPMTGMAEQIGKTTYKPTAQMRELLQARYPTCTAVGCNQPSHRCDIDHCCPFNGTNTTVDNLRPKCRHHHRMKHESSWTCENLDDGRHVWTTPRGKTYETEIQPIAEPAPF